MNVFVSKFSYQNLKFSYQDLKFLYQDLKFLYQNLKFSYQDLKLLLLNLDRRRLTGFLIVWLVLRNTSNPWFRQSSTILRRVYGWAWSGLLIVMLHKLLDLHGYAIKSVEIHGILKSL